MTFRYCWTGIVHYRQHTLPDTQLSKQQNDAIIRIDTAIQIQQTDKFNKSVVFLAGTDRSRLHSGGIEYHGRHIGDSHTMGWEIYHTHLQSGCYML